MGTEQKDRRERALGQNSQHEARQLQLYRYKPQVCCNYAHSPCSPYPFTKQEENIGQAQEGNAGECSNSTATACKLRAHCIITAHMDFVQGAGGSTPHSVIAVGNDTRTGEPLVSQLPRGPLRQKAYGEGRLRVKIPVRLGQNQGPQTRYSLEQSVRADCSDRLTLQGREISLACPGPGKSMRSRDTSSPQTTTTPLRSFAPATSTQYSGLTIQGMVTTWACPEPLSCTPATTPLRPTCATSPQYATLRKTVWTPELTARWPTNPVSNTTLLMPPVHTPNPLPPSLPQAAGYDPGMCSQHLLGNTPETLPPPNYLTPTTLHKQKEGLPTPPHPSPRLQTTQNQTNSESQSYHLVTRKGQLPAFNGYTPHSHQNKLSGTHAHNQSLENPPPLPQPGKNRQKPYNHLPPPAYPG